jgi:deoxyribonuclease-4
MIRTGLKLWSDNSNYLEAALALFREKLFDYIELYCVPGTFGGYVSMWKATKIPFIIHTAHSSHGFNLADMSLLEKNLEIFEESRRFADELEAPHIIVHPGILGSRSSVLRQMGMLGDERVLVENKPYLAMNREDVCAGSSPAEIKEYMRLSGGGACLDINHAYNAAKHGGMAFSQVIRDFLALGPSVIHICGVGSRYDVDEHIHLWEGDVALDRIFLLEGMEKIEYWTLETPKDSPNDLDDFLRDREYLERYRGRDKHV